MHDSPFVRLYAAMRRGLRTAGVARVEAYRPASQEADVLLLVQEEHLVDGERQPVPPIRVEGCPVIWAGGGTRGLTMGLEDGDEVMALYRHRSHDEIDTGAAGPVRPVSTRRSAETDVVLLPRYVCPAAGPDAAAYRSDGQPVFRMPGGEALHVGDSTAALLLARDDLLQSQLSTLKSAIAGAAVVGGDGGASFKAAILAALASWPGTTSSGRIKVDS